MQERERAAKSGRLILGIDPGTSVTGYGLLRLEGSRLRHVEHGVWRTQASSSTAARLLHLSNRLREFIELKRPVAMGIEQAFLGKNIQSTLRLGEARGALMVVGEAAGLSPREFAAATVKKSVTGQGRASKEQVQFMVQKLLGLSSEPQPADAADALAVAITMAMELRFSAPAARSQARRS